MKLTPTVGLLLLTILALACGEQDDRKFTSDPGRSSPATEAWFPFELYSDGNRYVIVAYLESDTLLKIYESFFAEHGYEGNGPCWEGHIIQILEELDRELLNHIEFDPEAGAFFAYAYSQASQHRFVEVLAPIFADLSKLDAYVQRAQRWRIYD